MDDKFIMSKCDNGENETLTRVDVGKPGGGNSPPKGYWWSPKLRNAVIKELGGTSFYYKFIHNLPKNVKNQMIIDAMKGWKKKLYIKYGSQTNYIRHWVKENGYDNLTDYKYKKAKEAGFKCYGDYQNFLYQRKGFKSKYDYEKKTARKLGLTVTQYRNSRRKQGEK